METVKLHVYRYNPEKDPKPHFEDYEVEVDSHDVKLLEVLIKLKAKDDSFSFRRFPKESKVIRCAIQSIRGPFSVFCSLTGTVCGFCRIIGNIFSSITGCSCFRHMKSFTDTITDSRSGIVPPRHFI